VIFRWPQNVARLRRVSKGIGFIFGKESMTAADNQAERGAADTAATAAFSGMSCMSAAARLLSNALSACLHRAAVK
jgi:hypothetical protein